LSVQSNAFGHYILYFCTILIRHIRARYAPAERLTKHIIWTQSPSSLPHKQYNDWCFNYRYFSAICDTHNLNFFSVFVINSITCIINLSLCLFECHVTSFWNPKYQLEHVWAHFDIVFDHSFQVNYSFFNQYFFSPLVEVKV
jgi:hypothetical protein